jgi:hypothetical protein
MFPRNTIGPVAKTAGLAARTPAMSQAASAPVSGNAHACAVAEAAEGISAPIANRTAGTAQVFLAQR